MHYSETFYRGSESNVMIFSCSDGQESCLSLYFQVHIWFSWPTKVQNLIGLVNLFIQIAAIYFVYSKKHLRTGPFYIFLFTLSVSIVFRTLYLFISTLIMCTNTNLLLGKKSETNNYVFIPNQLPKPIQKNNLDLFITTSVLYVDYCSNYFSMILIFVMSLNRCLQFIAQSTCEFIFNGKRIIISILVGLAGAGFSTRFVIVTSRIEREYSTKLTGFLDLGKPGGQITTVNHVYYLFPIGSLICYTLLYGHIRKQSKLILQATVSKSHEKGKQQIFIQLLITALFYGAMSVVGEVIPFFEFYKDTVIEIWLIPLLNITNYLPEIFLPFLLLIQNISCTRHQDRVSTLVISKSPSNQEAGNRVRVKAARI